MVGPEGICGQFLQILQSPPKLMISAKWSKPKSLKGGIKIKSPAITLAEILPHSRGGLRNRPSGRKEKGKHGKICIVRNACRKSLNVDHSSKPVPFRVLKVCASSKHSVITGSGRTQACFFFFFFDLLRVGDGGGLDIESINATRAARALQGGYSLEFFELEETWGGSALGLS